MDEQNKTPAPKPEQPEKKLSRTTLTFYIVGLFSVALALILISYVAQERADKQLESLNSQLSEQQTVAQGATQKMEDLQKQYDEQQQMLDGIRTTLGMDDTIYEDDLKDANRGVNKLLMRAVALSQLAAVQNALLDESYEEATTLYNEMVKQFTEPVLDRTGGDESLWVLTTEEVEIFKQVKQRIDEINTVEE